MKSPFLVYAYYHPLSAVTFSEVGKVAAANVNEYSFTDVNPLSGMNYFRVVSVDADGKKGFSSVAKVTMNAIASSINVYPNPVIGNNIHLETTMQGKGIYYISIKNQLGQTIDNRKVDFTGNQQSMDLNLSGKLTSGVYTLEVTNPIGEQSVVRFIK